MAIVITVNDIKDSCGGCMSESMTQLYIDSVTNKIGGCVEMSYDTATATLIMINLVCHFTCGSDGKITSEKAPNGASTNFQVAKTRSGLRSSQWGETVYDLDTKGCWQAMFASSFSFTTIGNKGVK